MPAFKIWNVDRSQKYSIFVKENEEIYQALIRKASQKLQIEGTVLVLESDGTIVDEDEAVIFYEKEIFMLLSENERWTPASTPSELIQKSTPSTPIQQSTPSEPSTVETYIVSEDGELLRDENPTNAPISPQPLNTSHTHTQSTNYEIAWKNFEIPFHKFPNDVIIEAEKTVPLEILKSNGQAAQTWLERRWRIQTQVVHIIVDEMRHIKTKIPMSAFKTIANKISERYPIFRDIDSDNVIIGDGCFTLTMKLIERNNYLNRPFKRKSTTAGKIPGKKSKKMANITSGCSNWDPERNEEILDQENLKNSLNIINETDENFHQHLEDSYSIIRTAINNNESLKEILNQWPILQGSKNAFYWHFQNLTKVDLTLLGMKINSKADKIIEYGIKNKLYHSDNNTDAGFAVLQIFSTYFKEDIKTFIFDVKEELLQEMLHSLESYSPCIFKIDKENHNKEYKIVIERDIFCSVDTFDSALEMAFGAFYIFNLEYPKNFCATLEMIQRYFLKIHPDQGSRSKKQGATKKKVISLMTKLYF